MQDRGVPEPGGGGGLLARVGGRAATRDPDLIGREPDPFGGAHRFEEVVHQPLHLLVHGGDRGRPLPQQGGAEQAEFANRHCGLDSTDRFTMFAMLARSTIKRVSPLFTETSSSFRCTTSPTIPPDVTTRSPRCRDASSSRCPSCCFRCGRLILKQKIPITP